jgi:hypothetical protein
MVVVKFGATEVPRNVTWSRVAFEIVCCGVSEKHSTQTNISPPWASTMCSKCGISSKQSTPKSALMREKNIREKIEDTNPVEKASKNASEKGSEKRSEKEKEKTFFERIHTLFKLL